MDIFAQVKEAIQASLSPPDNASGGEIRKGGIVLWIVGFSAIVITSLVIFPAMEAIPEAELLWVFAGVGFMGYAFMTVGCYRALTGSPASVDANDYTVSIRRTTVGVVAAILSLAIPGLIAWGILALLAALGLEMSALMRK